MSYRVLNLRPLHSGGNGDLFVGQRDDSGEPVVLKYLREHRSPHARKAFAREVRILERKQRGLVSILFADVNAERPYYVMPYLNGGALTRYAGRLNDTQLSNIATEIGVTLAILHGEWVAHGDIKPDNVLVTQKGRLQVADPLGNGLGCTVFFSQNHGGTPGYWAPEVRAGGPISCPGDVYSYGATLYHLMTGRRPRDDQGLDPASEGFVSAPKIREIITACCDFNPLARPTMQDVLRILRGERWTDIQAERKKVREFVTTLCILAGLFWAGTALAKLAKPT